MYGYPPSILSKYVGNRTQMDITIFLRRDASSNASHLSGKQEQNANSLLPICGSSLVLDLAIRKLGTLNQNGQLLLNSWDSREYAPCTSSPWQAHLPQKFSVISPTRNSSRRTQMLLPMHISP
ncbi:hypothetical protein TWF225_000150 [Orbilia oligospora]|nr:hypothetical protein TWF225_000150 [Orbilia oligospora]KAF3235140.1 hypothetical protein TWF128_002132 [Orbilia oligospora]KAF3259921.1 hypothetical protein TWF217_004955 [Orbilia oligospora]KAF3297512.1 hypothetical protein TWF132_005941 [Orbilia oligospora]